MKARLKTLTVAVVVVAALAALLAAGAQARTFTASSYPATGTGEQPFSVHHFTVQGQTAECEEAHFEGSLGGGASHSLTVTPKYAECAFAGVQANITMNGCDYEFTIDNPTDNSVHIRCPTINEVKQTITIEAPRTNPVCIVHIPEQTPTTNAIDYTNNAGGILITSTVSGIHSETTDGFLCPLNSSTTTDTGGTYTGTVQFNGTGGKTLDVG